MCREPGPTGTLSVSASMMTSARGSRIAPIRRIACATSIPLGFWSAPGPSQGSQTSMSQPEETYDDGRARNLEALLRALAERIQELDRQGRLLKEAGELMK